MRGVTLIEMVVALLVLGLLTALAGTAVGGLRRPPADSWQVEVNGARDSAIRTGRPVRFDDGTGYRALLLPDGRAVGAGLDPLTGEVTGVPR